MKHWVDLIRKKNEYAKQAMDMRIDEHADPKVQLEQALAAAQDRNSLLRDQAASIIADHKQAADRLAHDMNDLDEAKTDAQTALQLAAKYGDGTPEHQRYTQAAQIAASKVISLNTVIQRDQDHLAHCSQMATEAHQVVADNAVELQEALQKKAALIADLHDTEMEESLHSTMSALHSTANQIVPSLDQVAQKIEARKAKQEGYSDLDADSPDHALAEVHHQGQLNQANQLLDQMRSQLGLPAPATQISAGS